MNKNQNLQTVNNARLTNISQSNRLENITVSDESNYELAMLEVVADAFDLSSNVSVTAAEKMRVAKTWSRILFEIIPEERLMDTFEFAFQNHQTSFPVNAYDMKTAWNELQEIERAQIIENAQQSREQNPSEFCPRRHEHLPGFIEARVKIVNFYNTAEEIEVPCKDCREKAYFDWRTRFVAEHSGEKIQTIVDAGTYGLRIIPNNQPKASSGTGAIKCKNCEQIILDERKSYRIAENFFVCANCHRQIESACQSSSAKSSKF